LVDSRGTRTLKKKENAEKRKKRKRGRGAKQKKRRLVDTPSNGKQKEKSEDFQEK